MKSEEEYIKKKRGIKILYITGSSLLVACVLFALTCYGMIHVSDRYVQLTTLIDTYLSSQQDIRDVRETSYYLTDQARRFVATMDRQYMDAYFERLKETYELENVIARIVERQGTQSEITDEYLRWVLERPDVMSQAEIHSMKLICLVKGYEDLPTAVEAYELPQWEIWTDRAYKIDRANSLVYNQGYMQAKSRADELYSATLKKLSAETIVKEQESSKVLRNALNQQRIYIFLLFALIVFIFLMISLLILRPVELFVKRLGDDQPLDIVGSEELRYLAVTYNKMYEANVESKAILLHQAEHDALTDLLNRQAFEHLRGYLGAVEKPLAFLLIDLDHFKLVNDRYGHVMGDKVLKKVATILGESFRANDYLLRIGGDEFAVVMMDITEAEKDIIAKKLDAINAALTDSKDDLPKLSVSVGVAFSSQGYYKELYQHADEALYQTKKNGRCGYHFYE